MKPVLRTSEDSSWSWEVSESWVVLSRAARSLPGAACAGASEHSTQRPGCFGAEHEGVLGAQLPGAVRKGALHGCKMNFSCSNTAVKGWGLSAVSMYLLSTRTALSPGRRVNV